MTDQTAADSAAPLPCSAMPSVWLGMKEWRPAWVAKIFAEFSRCAKAPGWNPKIVRLDDEYHMIDVAGMGLDIGIPQQVCVIRYEDHPALFDLPKNAPRAVKAIYRKEVRLKHLRAKDYWTIADDLTKAKKAWADYLEAACPATGPAA